MTIVVLLILAGISLNAIIGNDGIIAKAFDSKKLSVEASEKERLQIEITSNQERNEEGKIESKIGEELKNKKVGEDWKVLVTEDGIYGTGWYYVAKGTNIPNHGKLENNWLINYETGEVKKVEDIRRLKDIENLDKLEEIGDNIILSSSDSLAVEEGLILNIDSSVIDGDVANEKEALQERLGEGVELVNFNYNDESGLTPTSFNLDGINDYIEVPCDDSPMYHADGTAYMGIDEEAGGERQLTKKEVLAQNGFTFEFYGIWNQGKSYWVDNNEEFVGYCNGLLYYGIKNSTDFSLFRFGFTHSRGTMNDLCLMWSARGAICRALSDYSTKNYEWEITYPLDSKVFKPNEPYYLTVTLDAKNVEIKNEEQGIYSNGTPFIKNGEFYKQKCYINGEIIYDSDFNKIQWDTFINDLLDSFDCFTIGRFNCEIEKKAWNYSKLNCYVLRLYNRGLNDEEIIENYKSSKVYHNFIEKLNKK